MFKKIKKAVIGGKKKKHESQPAEESPAADEPQAADEGTEPTPSAENVAESDDGGDSNSNNNNGEHEMANSAESKPNLRGGDKKKDEPPPSADKPPPRPPPEMTEDNMWEKADLSKFVLTEVRANGKMNFTKLGEQEQVEGKSIKKGIEMFKANPRKYVAMTYQTSMTDTKIWPVDQQAYTLYHRHGADRLQPSGIAEDGWQTVLMHVYLQLPPFEDNILPSKFRDEYTDHMMYNGRKLHSDTIKPIMPGRGMGWGDNPLLKIIGDIDPSDITQGEVGDCWLLSAISAIAEFDGAVKKLFRRTKNLDDMPLPEPNMYTVTLWSLETWQEVDIVIDERLACAPKHGNLLSSKPSEDGELWVCYLEKALAILCGGWDAIGGGESTHAWAMMTGCKEQYTIKRSKKTGKFTCHARYNQQEGKWAEHSNNPKKGDPRLWQVGWPEVGGGEKWEHECTDDELFKKLYAFDQVNYIVSAGTVDNASGKQDAGLVDKHAYTVIESVENAAGTGIDLLKMRNPWGSGEIEDGEFDDDGPGWDKYPQIKALLNPVVADDGIFWVTKEEFFKFFGTIYVSASNMTRFLED